MQRQFTGCQALLLLIMVACSLLPAARVHVAHAQPFPVPAAEAVIITPSATRVMVGDLVTATVTLISTDDECGFFAYDLTLSQTNTDSPVLAYVSPQKVGPPVSSTTIFTLTAVHSGTTTLQASVFGETQCNGGWQWTSKNGESVPIVAVEPVHIFLPIVGSA
ncbi:MAG TPA: hypothetical protein VFT66_20985 [Roseiflexaceae bacterium]|nr:hypothetical protein [Roseiflexaceae bacterium]